MRRKLLADSGLRGANLSFRALAGEVVTVDRAPWLQAVDSGRAQGALALTSGD